MGADITEISADRTYDLRRRVLRQGRADAVVTFPQDDVEGVFHLGAIDGGGTGTVVAVTTFIPTRPQIWQLRGMAVDESRQATGLGRTLLTAGVERIEALGARLLWANVRDTAAGFYERMGWTMVGHGFVTDEVAHHVGFLLL